MLYAGLLLLHSDLLIDAVNLNNPAMITEQQILQNHVSNVASLRWSLRHLPLSYIQNMRLHSFIKKCPLEALMIGKEVYNQDYDQRVIPWIIQAIATSPYLNN